MEEEEDVATMELLQQLTMAGFQLSVYGVVAVRDAIDHNRNLLFSHSRRKSQIIEQDVCTLSLLFIFFSECCCMSAHTIFLVDYYLQVT